MVIQFQELIYPLLLQREQGCQFTGIFVLRLGLFLDVVECGHGHHTVAMLLYSATDYSSKPAIGDTLRRSTDNKKNKYLLLRNISMLHVGGI